MSTVQVLDDVVDAELLAEITGDVFAGMFGEESERPYFVPATGVSYEVQSRVGISGGWNGTVLFSCGLTLVRFAAAELFGLPDDVVTDPDLRDLAGEVVNVIGGNIKSMLPGPSSLSLPRTVLDGSGRPEIAAVTADLGWSRHTLRVDVVPGTTGSAG